jgi:hypothetical protein|tara:strand:- start:471 stop:692 length:222 start_codon:yes stop_codon:yes gene_type:complete
MVSSQTGDTLTGVLFVIAAASIFSSIQEFEDAYIFPDRQFMNIFFPFMLGMGILWWKHKDIGDIISPKTGHSM